MLLIAMITEPTIAPDGAPIPATRPLIDVVVPVHNEQGSLERSIRRLHRFLDDHLPFAWRIVIADNASTDATPGIAAALALELPHMLRLPAKSRGRALRAAWSLSDARPLLHGRRPVDRLARASTADRRARLRPQRRRDRHPAGTGLVRGPRPQARTDLERV
jgi:glycosyltransferase involved in cell wall biosynthesis